MIFIDLEGTIKESTCHIISEEVNMEHIRSKSVANVLNPLIINSCILKAKVNAIQRFKASEDLPFLVKVSFNQSLCYCCKIYNVLIPCISSGNG